MAEGILTKTEQDPQPGMASQHQSREPSVRLSFPLMANDD